MLKRHLKQYEVTARRPGSAMTAEMTLIIAISVMRPQTRRPHQRGWPRGAGSINQRTASDDDTDDIQA